MIVAPRVDSAAVASGDVGHLPGKSSAHRMPNSQRKGDALKMEAAKDRPARPPPITAISMNLDE